jgi:hypothetical protein
MDKTSASALRAHLEFIMAPCIHGKPTSGFTEADAVFRAKFSSHAENTTAFVRTADAIGAVVSRFAENIAEHRFVFSEFVV